MLSLARQRGMHYRHSYITRMSLYCCFWAISDLCSQSIDVLSALEAFATKRYRPTYRHFSELHYITVRKITAFFTYIKPTLLYKWQSLCGILHYSDHCVIPAWSHEVVLRLEYLGPTTTSPTNTVVDIDWILQIHRFYKHQDARLDHRTELTRN